MLENDLDVTQLFTRGWDIKNERVKSAAHIPRYFFRDFFVAADQIGAKGLIVLEGPHPVDALHTAGLFDHLRELLVPDGIGNAHGQLVSELAATVAGKAHIGDVPSVSAFGTRDDANADSGLLAIG